MDFEHDEIMNTSVINGKFVVVKDNNFLSFERFDDIPESFDALVTFLPNHPEVDGHDYEWTEMIRILQPEVMRRINS